MCGYFKVIVILSKLFLNVEDLVASESFWAGLISLLIIRGFFWFFLKVPSIHFNLWLLMISLNGSKECSCQGRGAASTSISSFEVWSEVPDPEIP